MKSKTKLQNKLRTLKIDFKHRYKTQMILTTDRLRYESLKITHNELRFMCIQLQYSQQTTLAKSTQNIYLDTFETISVLIRNKTVNYNSCTQ